MQLVELPVEILDRIASYEPAALSLCSRHLRTISLSYLVETISFASLSKHNFLRLVELCALTDAVEAQTRKDPKEAIACPVFHSKCQFVHALQKDTHTLSFTGAISIIEPNVESAHVIKATVEDLLELGHHLLKESCTLNDNLREIGKTLAADALEANGRILTLVDLLHDTTGWASRLQLVLHIDAIFGAVLSGLVCVCRNLRNIHLTNTINTLSVCETIAIHKLPVTVMELQTIRWISLLSKQKAWIHFVFNALKVIRVSTSMVLPDMAAELLDMLFGNLGNCEEFSLQLGTSMPDDYHFPTILSLPCIRQFSILETAFRTIQYPNEIDAPNLLHICGRLQLLACVRSSQLSQLSTINITDRHTSLDLSSLLRRCHQLRKITLCIKSEKERREEDQLALIMSSFPISTQSFTCQKAPALELSRSEHRFWNITKSLDFLSRTSLPNLESLDLRSFYDDSRPTRMRLASRTNWNIFRNSFPALCYYAGCDLTAKMDE